MESQYDFRSSTEGKSEEPDKDSDNEEKLGYHSEKEIIKRELSLEETKDKMNHAENESALQSLAENQESTKSVQKKKKTRKVLGDIHLNTKHLKAIGNDFWRSMFSFFNENIMMRKLHSLRKFHRPKVSKRKSWLEKLPVKNNQNNDVKPGKPKPSNNDVK